MFPFQKILCPIDFSDPSYEALAIAEKLALQSSSELCVVHVVPSIPFVPESPLPPGFNISLLQLKLEEKAKKSLQDEAEKRVSEKVLLHPVVTSGNPAEEIARIAQEDKAELIVIASHGESGWRLFIHGSVTERVLRLAPCHVLVVRASHD
jgi:universal stress protein A